MGLLEPLVFLGLWGPLLALLRPLGALLGPLLRPLGALVLALLLVLLQAVL